MTMESDSKTNDPAGRPIVRERSYPLVALLLLATVWAAMFACVDGQSLLRGFQADSWRNFGTWIAPAVLMSVGACVGAAVGMSQVRVWRSVAVGGLIGSVYGVAIFAVYAAPAGFDRAASSAVVIMVSTIALRFRAD
jgi:hypothetical protein